MFKGVWLGGYALACAGMSMPAVAQASVFPPRGTVDAVVALQPPGVTSASAEPVALPMLEHPASTPGSALLTTPVDDQPSRPTAVPLPTAALPGLLLLAGMGVRRAVRRRRLKLA